MDENSVETKEDIFKSSIRELKMTHTIVFCGLMGAMGAVLKLVTSIGIGNYLRIGFDWIPSRIVDFMFGPVVGTLFGAIMDVVKHFLKPMGSFDFRFTLVPMVAGFVYGLLLYKKPVSLKRVFLGKLFETVVLHIIVNTYLISTVMGKGFLAILPARLIKNAISLPLETILLFFILTTISKLLPRLKKYGSN